LNPSRNRLHFKDTHELKGDMDYFNGSEWARLERGSAGQVLQMTSGVPAWVTEPAVSITAITTLLSGTFAIDSTGVKTVTTAHGLSVTPALHDVQVSVVEESNVDDWAFDLLKVESVDATNVVCKINVSTASATGSATAKLALLVVTGV
jgi:ribosomal protein L12E/L44/L45/RPP1/RPP2